MVAKRSVHCRIKIEKFFGNIRSDYIGMSNNKEGKNPSRQKSKGFCARINHTK